MKIIEPHLINVYIIKNWQVSLRHFIIDADLSDILDVIYDCGGYDWKFDVNRLVNKYHPKEVLAANIFRKEHHIKRCMPVITSDVDFKYNGNIRHFRSDTDLDPSGLTFEYGDEDHMYGRGALSIHMSRLVNQTDFTHNDGSGRYYAVLDVSELDEEPGDGITLFESKADAQSYIAHHRCGEVAPYIFLNSDYPWKLSDYCKMPKTIGWNQCHTLTKPVDIMSPILFSGRDFYN